MCGAQGVVRGRVPARSGSNIVSVIRASCFCTSFVSLLDTHVLLWKDCNLDDYSIEDNCSNVKYSLENGCTGWSGAVAEAYAGGRAIPTRSRTAASVGWLRSSSS